MCTHVLQAALKPLETGYKNQHTGAVVTQSVGLVVSDQSLLSTMLLLVSSLAVSVLSVVSAVDVSARFSADEVVPDVVSAAPGDQLQVLCVVTIPGLVTLCCVARWCMMREQQSWGIISRLARQAASPL